MEKPDYKNWMPKWMIEASLGLTGVCGVITAIKAVKKKKCALSAATTALGAAVSAWLIYSYRQYSYNGRRQLSKQIVEGTADYIKLKEGETGLDVGCGSGALTIACAKKNPQGKIVGIDRWGIEYKDFSQALCEDNAKAEGVNNVSFKQGDAVKLDFPDESFDAVTSNYVYHNIPVKKPSDRQQLIKETLRVLKKGGTFAIHDIFTKMKYGDLQRMIDELRAAGYEEVRLIPTDEGKFMTKREARILGCAGSALLVGKK